MSDKANPFDFVKSINYGKTNIIRDSENPKLMEKSYIPFMTNRNQSYFPDTLIHANNMNLNWHIPNIMQYEYYLHGVRQRKRFQKWAKPEKLDDVERVMEYYNCNRNRASEYVSILTDDQLEQIAEKLQKGGDE